MVQASLGSCTFAKNNVPRQIPAKSLFFQNMTPLASFPHDQVNVVRCAISKVSVIVKSLGVTFVRGTDENKPPSLLVGDTRNAFVFSLLLSLMLQLLLQGSLSWTRHRALLSKSAL